MPVFSSCLEEFVELNEVEELSRLMEEAQLGEELTLCRCLPDWEERDMGEPRESDPWE